MMPHTDVCCYSIEAQLQECELKCRSEENLTFAAHSLISKVEKRTKPTEFHHQRNK